MECYEGNRYENMLRDFSMACVEQGLIDPKFVIDEDTGNEVTIPPPFPTEWSICDCCRGDGAHALYGIAIVADDWNEWHDFSKVENEFQSLNLHYGSSLLNFSFRKEENDG